MSRIITTIEEEDIIENDDGTVSFTAKAAIDSDGSGPHFGDTTAQDDTSLHLNGQPLNASADKYIVVPPAIVNGVRGIVLGCQAHVTNTQNGLETDAVVGDVVPHLKLGEISIATADAIGINSSPTQGGTDDHVIFYKLIRARLPLLMESNMICRLPENEPARNVYLTDYQRSPFIWFVSVFIFHLCLCMIKCVAHRLMSKHLQNAFASIMNTGQIVVTARVDTETKTAAYLRN